MPLVGVDSVDDSEGSGGGPSRLHRNRKAEL